MLWILKYEWYYLVLRFVEGHQMRWCIYMPALWYYLGVWVSLLLKYCPSKPSDTQRSRRTWTLFDAGSPRWAHTQNSGSRAGKLLGSYRAVQGIGLQWMCWLLIGGLTLGVRYLGCLGGSSGRPVSGSLFTEGEKERQEWWLSPCGAFYLGPGPILWLN
jgi:hypothetical protein